MSVIKLLKSGVKALSGSKKQRKEKGSSSVGGVYVSTRQLLERKDSSKSIDTASTASTTTTTTNSPACSWKSTVTKGHNRNVPLVVSDPEHSTEITDQAEALGRIMARSRQLPSTWYFSSNHVMVNQERTKRVMAPLVRLRELDEIAREHAERMASENALFHSTPDELQSKFNRPSRRLGENVKRGDTIRKIHEAMMKDVSDKINILDRRYTHMGMATARGSDGNLYLCQVFRG